MARAAAGALIFGLPLLMTMEVWWFGFEMSSIRLAVLLVFNLLLLIGLSRVAGFEESEHLFEDVLDALSAMFVASVVAAILLYVMGVIDLADPLRETVGKIALQSVPCGFGAMIGAKLLGEGDDIEEHERWRETYAGTLFLMLAGALFLGLSVAPTEEMPLIAYQMSGWQTLALTLLSILLLHLIVYNVGFGGQEERAVAGMAAFARFTLPGYAIAIGASAFILWCFGRLDADLAHGARVVAVLALPGAVGAAIGRLVI